MKKIKYRPSSHFLISIILILIAALFFVVYSYQDELVYKITRSLFPITSKENMPNYSLGQAFITTCQNLNGKEFTFENLQTLNGKIFAGAAKANTQGVITGAFNGPQIFEKKYVDQFHQAINDRKSFDLQVEQNPLEIHVFIFPDETIDFTRNDLKNDWNCRIGIDRNTGLIESRSEFAYYTD